MLDWWEENGPPVYIAVAGYLGLIKKKKSGSNQSKPAPSEMGDLEDLLSLAGPGGMII